MRVLITGGGRAGLSVGSHLRQTGHEVTLVDRDPAVVARAYEEFGLVSITGDATDATFLRDAEVARADVVVTMLARDADNLAVAMLAREAGARRTMVRMRDPLYRPIYLAAGVHRIVSETDVFIGGIATAIEHEGVKHSMFVGDGGAVAFELSVEDEAAVVGRTVSDIAADPAFPSSCVFAGMYEPTGGVQAPRGGSIVNQGMTILLVARREQLPEVIRFFERRAR